MNTRWASDSGRAAGKMAGHAAIGAMQAETPGLEPATIRATVELSTGPLGHQILPRKAADSVDYDNSTIGQT
jgi:hypothetical protein